MKKLGLKWKNIIFIILGSAIFSFGLVHFNIQNELGEGGFTGITLLLLYLFDLDPGVMNIVLNIPILLIGWTSLGKQTFYYTLLGIVSVSVFIWVAQSYMIVIDLSADLTLASLFAGVFIGVGLGIIFRYGGTTGGVDIIARLINKHLGWSMGRAMFVFDTVVIFTSIVTYLNPVRGMYTLVAVFISARVIDFIQEGAYAARGVTIISNHSEQIAGKILVEMDRGVTTLEGRGTFTGEKRDVLYCIIGRLEIVRMKQIIETIDPHAFVAVSHVHDVIGEGFTLDENKNPIDP
ncbi:YitT family protein [Salimicrobium jeotgali]|uniref:YitT family protein n=1 Tax=Salimicrobium jeotgali TaxID=1230341 RepID=UPI000C84E2C0|nr:YitT family protein [Salimicrobium jeotgali]